MEDLNKFITDINALKYELISIINNTEPSQELLDKLSDIKQDYKDIYEVITLIKSEFYTDSKMTKKQLIEIINKLFDIKISLINKIIQDKLVLSTERVNEPEKKKPFGWLLSLLGVDSLSTIAIIIIGVLLTLFLMYTTNPEAANKSIQAIKDTTLTIKGD